jgi:hypothetical protein
MSSVQTSVTEVQKPSQRPCMRRFLREVCAQRIARKVLSRDIVRKSAWLLADITIRKSQGAQAAPRQTCGEVGHRFDHWLRETSDEGERWHSACTKGIAIPTRHVPLHREVCKEHRQWQSRTIPATRRHSRTSRWSRLSERHCRRLMPRRRYRTACTP